MDNSKAVEQLLGSWSGPQATESMLIDKGIYSKASVNRQNMLRCIGCLWARREAAGDAPGAFVGEIAHCSRMSGSSADLLMRTLVEGKFVVAHKQSASKRTATPYLPADSEKGQLFRTTLGAPDECQSPVDDLPPVAKEKAHNVTKLEALTEAQALVGGLRAFREERGISQLDVAEATGMHNSVISRIDQFGRASLTESDTHVTVTSVASLVAYAAAIGAEVVLQPRSEQPAEQPIPQEPTGEL